MSTAASSNRGLLVTGILAVLVLGGLVALRLTAVERGIASAKRAMDAHDLVTAEAEWRGVLAEEPSRPDALYRSEEHTSETPVTL